MPPISAFLQHLPEIPWVFMLDVHDKIKHFCISPVGKRLCQTEKLFAQFFLGIGIVRISLGGEGFAFNQRAVFQAKDYPGKALFRK